MHRCYLSIGSLSDTPNGPRLRPYGFDDESAQRGQEASSREP